MRVAQLQQFLRSLIPPLEDARANLSVVQGLRSACDGLDPFRDYEVEQFAQYVQVAKKYKEDGILPEVAQTKSGKSSGAKKPAVPGLTPEEARSHVQSLIERVGDPALTSEVLKAEVDKLRKLSASDFDALLVHFGLSKGKNFNLRVASILKKIEGHRNNNQNKQTILHGADRG